MVRLAECVRRPEAVLFLRSPPDDEELADYRAAQGAGGRLSPDDLLKIRRVRYAQAMARDMMEAQGASARPQIGGGAATSEPAEEAAERMRGSLGMKERRGSTSLGGLYRRLREAIESLNILVFQYPMDAGSVRGLALTGRLPYAILINSRDPEAARAFAILHQYGHVLTRSGGICGEQASGSAVAASAGQRAEAWCNRFAAALLMPRDEFVAERRRCEEALHDAGRVVEELAKRFKTSRYAAATRAASLPGGSLGGGYADLLETIANKYAQGPRKGAGGRGGGPKFVDVRVAQLGLKFARLALSSYDRGLINARNLIDYLDMDVKHLEDLRARVRKG